MCNYVCFHSCSSQTLFISLVWSKTLPIRHKTSIIYQGFSDKFLLIYREERGIVLAWVLCQVSSVAQQERRPCAYWVPDLRGQPSTQLHRVTAVLSAENCLSHKIFNPQASKLENACFFLLGDGLPREKEDSWGWNQFLPFHVTSVLPLSTMPLVFTFGTNNFPLTCNWDYRITPVNHEWTTLVPFLFPTRCVTPRPDKLGINQFALV